VRSILTPPKRRGIEILDDPDVDPDVVTRSLADVVRSNSLFGGLSSAIDELKDAFKDVPRKATLLDVGTGLGDIPCRAREVARQSGIDLTTVGLDSALELARATRMGTALAVAVFDVDDFAGINEQHGAGVGDDVLRSVAATLADQVRLVDTVARIGPDEFGVIAPGDSSGMVARRVRDAVADLPAIDGVHASIRAGVSHHPQDGTSSGDLLDAAHVAIAQARVEGAGTVVGLRGMPDLEAGPLV